MQLSNVFEKRAIEIKLEQYLDKRLEDKSFSWDTISVENMANTLGVRIKNSLLNADDYASFTQVAVFLSFIAKHLQDNDHVDHHAMSWCMSHLKSSNARDYKLHMSSILVDIEKKSINEGILFKDCIKHFLNDNKHHETIFNYLVERNKWIEAFGIWSESFDVNKKTKSKNYALISMGGLNLANIYSNLSRFISKDLDNKKVMHDFIDVYIRPHTLDCLNQSITSESQKILSQIVDKILSFKNCTTEDKLGLLRKIEGNIYKYSHDEKRKSYTQSFISALSATGDECSGEIIAEIFSKSNDEEKILFALKSIKKDAFSKSSKVMLSFCDDKILANLYDFFISNSKNQQAAQISLHMSEELSNDCLMRALIKKFSDSDILKSQLEKINILYNMNSSSKDNIKLSNKKKI